MKPVTPADGNEVADTPANMFAFLRRNRAELNATEWKDGFAAADRQNMSHAAWGSEYHQEQRTDDRVLAVLSGRWGWRKRREQRLLTLHGFVVAESTGLWLAVQNDMHGRSGSEDAHRVFLAHRLIAIADALFRRGGMRRDEALVWMTVLAGHPHRDADGRLLSLLGNPAVDGGRCWSVRLTGLRRDRLEMDRWREAAPPHLAALAWAVGLTVDETADRYGAGALEIEALQVLAGLRGVVTPPA